MERVEGLRPPPPGSAEFHGGLGAFRHGNLFLHGMKSASYPFGTLRVSSDELCITGPAHLLKVWSVRELTVAKSDIRVVRLSRRLLATHVSLIWPDGTEAEPWFSTAAIARVATALTDFGWPLARDHDWTSYPPRPGPPRQGPPPGWST